MCKMPLFYCFILWTISSSLGETAQIDAVVLDELLREIVDSSMSDLRHRLQEAVFATSFRRKILEQHATSSEFPTSSKSSNSKNEHLEKLLDDYIKPQKLSLSLETFTQKPTTVIPVQLVTADDVAISESGRLFKDDVEYSEGVATSSFLGLPRVPIYVAITVIVMCVLTFFLLIGTVIYFLASKSKRNNKLNIPRGMLDPLSVQGLSTCNVSPNYQHRSSLHIPTSEFPKFSNSRRNSLYLDQDRASSSIWAHP